MVLPISALLVLAACGGDKQADMTPAEIAAALDAGPRAAEAMTLDDGKAAWGAQLFQSKACITCHAVGERKQGPDLAGVANRRTEQWIKKQILNPEWMLKHDPIARQLMAEYALQMANQQVKEAEANALIHYLLRETLAGK